MKTGINGIHFSGILFALFLFQPVLSASSFTAGSDKTINFEKASSIQLEGEAGKGCANIHWSNLSQGLVDFTDTNDPKSEATFSRPGVYLLVLSVTGPKKESLCDSVLFNVYAPKFYKNRLSDLIALMTAKEKIGQLVNQTEAIPRLNLPAYNYWSEALHGILDQDATSFPQAVAMGSTWDPALVHRVATAISDEARIKNMLTGKGLSYWSPTVNIARDPRWGRNEESYSEDPYLLSRMGVAFVTGMQGDDPYYLKVVSTPKHFIANNEEARRHSGSSDVGMRCLWEYFMPAFEKTITEGKAFSIMGAYNELNHVPCCGNQYLLTDILRRKWGFEGYVVSDCGAISDMVTGHHFFKTGAEAAARGILSGCDLNCGSYYTDYLQEALDLNLIEEKDLDKALEHVLSARFRLGEFDPTEANPYGRVSVDKLQGTEHQALALEAARKSIVLLKNDGILPINTKKVKSIAVIGPNAAECQLGIYSGWPKIQVSPLEGIQTKAESKGISVTYTLGCEIGGGLLRPIEPEYFTEIEGTGKKGMRAEFFGNMNLQGDPITTRIDSMVDFSFGTAPPAPGVPKDEFSIRWTGHIVPPETRTFKLGTRTDDGARLFVNGDLFLEDWTSHGEKPNAGSIDFEAGKPYEVVFEYYDGILGAAARLTWDLGQKDFTSAREIAKDKDLVILVLGTSPDLSEEELDRDVIELPEVQRELLKEVASVNSNIVVVLINGGPVALAGSEKYAKAIVEAWYTGQSEGTAIADVLFGDVNPGGKLPVTFYASTSQLPPFADYDIINHPRTYMYFEEPVLYPFGYGLSYTRFEFSDLKISTNQLKKDESVEIECSVKNTGKVAGDEIVQVYVKDVEASVKVAAKQLKRFQRVSLNPGESKTVRFILPASELTFYDVRSNEMIVEPGMFEIQIGSSSQDIRLSKTFEVRK